MKQKETLLATNNWKLKLQKQCYLYCIGKMKYGVNLIKDVTDLYTENYGTLLRETTGGTQNEERIHYMN